MMAVDSITAAAGASSARAGELLVKTTGLSVGFGRRAILPPIDVTVRRGELWGVVGRNGAGKTTLFRTLLGLHAPLSGTIGRSSGVVIGYVPQRYAVDPLVPARARDLIIEGADAGLSFLKPFLPPDAKGRIARAIEVTGSAPFLHRRYRDLSEGQKQRVLLARALAGAPDLLVLDEPTSAMDLVAEREVLAILRAIKQRSSIGILLVSHHLGAVLPIVDHVLFLDADDAIAVSGPTAEVTRHPVFAERYGAIAQAHEEPAG